MKLDNDKVLDAIGSHEAKLVGEIYSIGDYYYNIETDKFGIRYVAHAFRSWILLA